jgi:heme-degrading monooxygenase HmoA
MAEYTYLWEFEVKAGMEPAFEAHYGPNGEWVALFRRSPDYLGTLLLRDRRRPQRYLTIDRWRSEEAYRRFRDEHDAQYREIDRLCEALTAREVSLGEYARVPEEAP